MAKVTQLVDDIDGSAIDEEQEGAGTLVFAVADEFYSIDLNAKNRAAFDKAVQKFVDSAVSIDNPYAAAVAVRPGRGGRSPRMQSVSPAANRERLQMIREWARGQGYEVSDRGRIAGEIQDAYEAAH